MTDDNERTPWMLERLLHSGDPDFISNRPDARDLAENERGRGVRKLLKIRDGYKGEWNAGAKYLYSELIRAYGLDGEWSEILMEIAKPTPGRKHSSELAFEISTLKQQGMTAEQIAEQFEREGRPISKEAVEAYSKRRRNKSIEEMASAAVQKAMQRRGK